MKEGPVDPAYFIIYTYIYILDTHKAVSCPVCTNAYINDLFVAGGHMSREALRALPGSSKGLVKKYVDKSGRKRHVGVPSRLKSSQWLVQYLVHFNHAHALFET